MPSHAMWTVWVVVRSRMIFLVVLPFESSAIRMMVIARSVSAFGSGSENVPSSDSRYRSWPSPLHRSTGSKSVYDGQKLPGQSVGRVHAPPAFVPLGHVDDVEHVPPLAAQSWVSMQ